MDFGFILQATAAKDIHKKDEKDLKREHGRKFIETLLGTFKADVDAQVQEKTFEGSDTVPIEEKDRYANSDEGVCMFPPFMTKRGTRNTVSKYRS